jgi:DNA-binding response OmpR family regulator
MEETGGMILVVDDDESIRAVLCRKLKAEGYYCDVAADGREALRKASAKDFDLVLMDIKMPGLSGMEVLSHLVTERPDISVVMITAVVDAKTAVDAMKLGAYDYVTKPFDLDDVSMRVKRALERRKLVLENKEYQLRLEQKVEQQVRQIRQYYQEAIKALSREQIALQELEAVRRTVSAEAVPRAEVALKSDESLSGVEEFAKKLTQLFSDPSGGVSKEKRINSTSVQAEMAKEIGKQQTQPNSEEKTEKDEGFDLYEGTVELAMLPPVSLQQMLQVHQHLQQMQQMKVLNLGGSVDKGITIRVYLKMPVPLLKIVRELPDVERASAESAEPESIIPAQQGESPKVRRVVVTLLKRPPANIIDNTAR